MNACSVAVCSLCAGIVLVSVWFCKVLPGLEYSLLQPMPGDVSSWVFVDYLR